MKTIRILSAAIIVAGCFSSCSKNDNPKTDNISDAVVFTASIDAQSLPASRAANTTWAINDAIGVSMVENGTTPIAIVDETVNREYTTSTTVGNFSATTTSRIYYPEDGSSVDFIAYYPFQPNASINASATSLGTYTVNVGNQANPELIDLMWANTTSGYNKNTVGGVPLVFNHQLSKLVMICQPGEGLTTADLTGMTISINGMSTQNTFNLTTGQLGTTTAPSLSFAPQTVTDGSRYEAIILPAAATTTVGQFNVTFTINPTSADPETFTWNMAIGTNFITGNEYTYTVNISRIGVTATGTINPWITDGNNRGEVSAQ